MEAVYFISGRTTPNKSLKIFEIINKK